MRKKKKKSQPARSVPPPVVLLPRPESEPAPTFGTALPTIAGLLRELARIQRQCDDVGRQLDRQRNPSLKHELSKVQHQLTTNYRQLLRPAIDMERESKTLLEAADVEQTIARANLEFKGALEAMGHRLATLPIFAGINPVTVELAVKSECATVLEQLEHQWSEALPSKPIKEWDGRVSDGRDPKLAEYHSAYEKFEAKRVADGREFFTKREVLELERLNPTGLPESELVWQNPDGTIHGK